ncbi:O-glucosyltransferase rumi homolog isoform X2 [Ipomoea triloba]|uniref:O-glucosyltransferase rumi homolog isoform X2 n=1 Tax=Ipomoea triloba TaxID=35885 RepID=UPI00125D0CB7|nr:O-glucosyltransferase rumi homolog isoform X2 [Ipomoea triloba]
MRNMVRPHILKMRETSEGVRLYRHFTDTIWRPLPAIKTLARSSLAIFFFMLLCVGAFVSTRLLDSTVTAHPTRLSHQTIIENEIRPLNCSLGNPMASCPANYYPSKLRVQDSPTESSSTCPDYFRWIYDDLWAWRESGISREMVMSARRTANFRLVIVNGIAYYHKYRKSFQSRDTFTLWGILQLLRRYPGKVPDLDLMFDTVDWPVIKKQAYVPGRRPNDTTTAPPPLFRYCGDEATWDIVFPDWSFWGWPEINIKPWKGLSKELKEGNGKIKWVDREPYAYWKGNPAVAETRKDLLKCNVSEKQDWGARVYAQDWIQEQKQGYQQSNLADQCIHRYKIYIEGSAWSVSEKYILACDSLTLLVKPHYYDFYTRGLMPMKHYWPIRDDDKCKSIKHAVDWGNNHHQQAHEIGMAGSKYIQEELKMEYVYDYMFHLLSEYAKLLKYKPTVPPEAVELCSEKMVCGANGLEKQFMMESLVKAAPSATAPCTMPPPFDPATLNAIVDTRESSIKQVESWEKQYWHHQNNPDI